MKIQTTLFIFLFFFIASDVNAMDIDNKENQFTKIHFEKIAIENKTIALEKLSKYEEEVKIEKRSFLIKLEETIKNCPFNSTCSEYNIDKSYFTNSRFNCEEFALATFFHTTEDPDHDKHCTMINIDSSIENSIISEITENLTTFVDALSHEIMENKMCLIYAGGASNHVIALEVRKHGFYIHNSWNNCFSNSWFSGLTKKDEFNLSPMKQNMFHEYREKCGLGKCLTKTDVKNCLIDLGHIFNVVGKNVYGTKRVFFQFACKELNEDFKILMD